MIKSKILWYNYYLVSLRKVLGPTIVQQAMGRYRCCKKNTVCNKYTDESTLHNAATPANTITT
jgi:hypothetical protein